MCRRGKLVNIIKFSSRVRTLPLLGLRTLHNRSPGEVWCLLLPLRAVCDKFHKQRLFFYYYISCDDSCRSSKVRLSTRCISQRSRALLWILSSPRGAHTTRARPRLLLLCCWTKLLNNKTINLNFNFARLYTFCFYRAFHLFFLSSLSLSLTHHSIKSSTHCCSCSLPRWFDMAKVWARIYLKSVQFCEADNSTLARLWLLLLH